MYFKISIIALMAAIGVATDSPVNLSSNTLADLNDRSVELQKRAHDGKATVYYQNGVTGSCGHVHADGDKLVALGNYWWNHFGKDYLCGHFVKITNTGPKRDKSIGGKGNVVYARVADTCEGCREAHLDLSKGAWSALTNNAAESVVGIHWLFVSG